MLLLQLEASFAAVGIRNCGETPAKGHKVRGEQLPRPPEAAGCSPHTPPEVTGHRHRPQSRTVHHHKPADSAAVATATQHFGHLRIYPDLNEKL